MTAPKLLLLASTPPGSEVGYAAVGGIFLKDLCEAYPHDRLCSVALTAPFHEPPPSLSWLPIMMLPLPKANSFFQRFSRRQLKWLAPSLAFQYARFAKEKTLLDQAASFAQQQQVELVWAVLETPLLFRLASRLAGRLSVPLVTTVWDPPETREHLDRFSRHMALRSFDKTISGSLRCGVASEAMSDEYRTRYGVQTTVMIHGIARRRRCPPASRLASENRFVVGFAGGFYTDNEWNALVGALSSVNWRIKGRNVIVKILSKNLRIATEGYAQIEYLGWRSLEEVIRVLSDCDVSYLPYWFNPIHKVSVRLCFPNKLTVYLASGRPVFFHGPLDSSPAKFLNKYPAGLCCHSLDKNAIVETLERFATDEGLYARMARAGQDALDQELDQSVFRRRFAELIGIEETELVQNSD